MNDVTLRELEQRWRETGLVEDEGKYLEQRVKLDDLDQDRLELAAYLGHGGSRAALGGEVAQGPSDLRDWVLEMERFGIEASVGAALAAVRLLKPGQGATQKAVDAAQALLDCPCDEHEKKARKAWTEDADWAYQVSWAELAAEVAWAARWAHSPAAVRNAIAKVLVPFALLHSEEVKRWRESDGDC